MLVNGWYYYLIIVISGEKLVLLMLYGFIGISEIF